MSVKLYEADPQVVIDQMTEGHRNLARGNPTRWATIQAELLKGDQSKSDIPQSGLENSATAVRTVLKEVSGRVNEETRRKLEDVLRSILGD